MEGEESRSTIARSKPPQEEEGRDGNREEVMEEERKHHKLKFTVWANGVKVPPEISSVPFEINLPRDSSVETLLIEVRRHFGEVVREKGLEGPTKENGRLVKCSRFCRHSCTDRLVRTEFVSPADMKKKLLSLLSNSEAVLNNTHFLYDTKGHSQACYAPIHSDRMMYTCKVYLVNIKKRKIEPSFLFPIGRRDTVAKFREELGAYLVEEDFKEYRVVYEMPHTMKLLDSPAEKFKDITMGKESCVLYVDGGSPGEEADKDRKFTVDGGRFASSLMHQIIKSYQIEKTRVVQSEGGRNRGTGKFEKKPTLINNPYAAHNNREFTTATATEHLMDSSITNEASASETIQLHQLKDALMDGSQELLSSGDQLQRVKSLMMNDRQMTSSSRDQLTLHQLKALSLMDDNSHSQMKSSARELAKNLTTSSTIDDDSCIFCYDAPRDAVFLECEHQIACYECAMRIKNRDGICPYDRLPIARVFKPRKP